MVEPQFPSQSDVPLIPAPMIYVNEAITWEYKRLARDLKKESALSEDDLNALGQDGWELAGAFADSKIAYYYFKRMVGS